MGRSFPGCRTSTLLRIQCQVQYLATGKPPELQQALYCKQTCDLPICTDKFLQHTMQIFAVCHARAVYTSEPSVSCCRAGISDQGANFIPNLLAEWQASRAVLRAVSKGLTPSTHFTQHGCSPFCRWKASWQSPVWAGV